MSVLKLHNEPLQEAWLDAYGHLNEAYYLVPFSNTTWKLQDHFDIGVDYFEETGCAIYTVETHLRYLSDVRKTALMEIESMILGVDAKRIWFAHKMMVNDVLCATGEFMVLHYDTNANRTTAMPNSVIETLGRAATDSRPEWVGRRLSLDKR
ncbi:MAG: hypothetical protein GKR96_09095 [Gammaproteobacteria bacterium]|nr:hypothetical protein [Gammaproteobacteria bacterium]